MTANEPHPGTRTRPTGTHVPLVCPECGEPARAVPPREWPLAGWTPRPRFSHHDGTPLCPVVGPDGYTPAEPALAVAAGAAPGTTAPADRTATDRTPTDRTSANGTDTARDDDDRCRTEDCPGDPNDGHGSDGYCASCADRHEAAGTRQ